MRGSNAFVLVWVSVVVWGVTSLSAQTLVVSQNTTWNSDLAGHVIVRNGARLTVIDAAISGDVVVEQGGSFIGIGARIEGHLTATDANAVVLRSSATRGPELSGDLRLRRMSGTQRILGADIGGRMLIEDSAATEITVRDCSIDGDLQLFGNQVAEAFQVRNNLILGSLQVGWSEDSPQLIGNSVARGVAEGSEVAILARGFSGGETLALQIDQRTVEQWQVEAGFALFRFRSTAVLTPDRIRAAAIVHPGEVDDLTNGLVVDWLELDAEVYQAEHPSVYARGAAYLGVPVRPGFHLTETLPFQGFFQFGIDGIEDDFLIFQLNAALPDGWRHSLFKDSSHVRVRTYDAAGKEAFYSRFGSTGVISSIQDSRAKRQLIAPPFKNESTDRVLQWTIWETGSKVVHDVPSLPWFEDRFNITQAGTYRNVFQGTVQVVLDSVNGQLDVWSVHDRQWKSELEPYLGGVFTSLTRTNMLDGGAMLVRRVIRVGKVTKYGSPVNISDPLFEAWSPFADSAFDAIALDVNSSGTPTWFYINSRNIPHYPHWPALTTRGWAIAYHRSRILSGTMIAVVFGRDAGSVILPNGQTAAPRRYDLNTMDFSGGMAILPGYWPGSLPEGSLVDQSFIFLPGFGISATTPRMLDDLVNRLPPPCTYHAGAVLSGELSVIADRLSTLQTEKQTRTDSLGTVK